MVYVKGTISIYTATACRPCMFCLLARALCKNNLSILYTPYGIASRLPFDMQYMSHRRIGQLPNTRRIQHIQACLQCAFYVKGTNFCFHAFCILCRKDRRVEHQFPLRRVPCGLKVVEWHCGFDCFALNKYHILVVWKINMSALSCWSGLSALLDGSLILRQPKRLLNRNR